MSQPKLLLVDDSPNILKALRRTFALEDYHIICASSATEAMSVLANEDIDIIISDENMPNVTGTELLKQVRDMYPGIVRMMLTGATDIDVVKKAVNQGEIYRFFTKPWEDYELLIAVMHAMKMKKLEKENERLKTSIRNQELQLRELESEYPGIAEIRLASDGAIIID